MAGDLDNQVSSQQSRIAEVEPFLRDTVQEAWQVFKRDPTLFIVGGALACMLSILSVGILAGPMSVGLIQTVHRRLHGQSARIRDVMDGMSAFVSAFVAAVLIGVAVALLGLLAVLPAMVVLACTCFAFHELCYRKGTAIDAIKGSFQILKAHLLHVLLLLSGIGLLNALSFIAPFASLVTIPFSIVVMTVAYEKLSGQTTGSQIAVAA